MYNTIRVPNSLKRGVGPWQFFAVFFFFLSFFSTRLSFFTALPHAGSHT